MNQQPFFVSIQEPSGTIETSLAHYFRQWIPNKQASKQTNKQTNKHLRIYSVNVLKSFTGVLCKYRNLFKTISKFWGEPKIKERLSIIIGGKRYLIVN